ncbi:hypothetical protein ALPO108162_07075 [Alicyclobacillus pomorum]|jgi:hypothetical protein
MVKPMQPSPQPNDDKTKTTHPEHRRVTKQTAPVNSLVDVDSPDDFRDEGKYSAIQSTDNEVPWVKVDNPDDHE